MQHALAMDVVELEALDERAVDESGVRGGEAPVGGPNAAAGRAVDRCQRLDQDAAPFEPGAEDRAAERIQHQQFDALDHLPGNLLVTQIGDERGDAERVRVAARRLVGQEILRVRSAQCRTSHRRSASEGWWTSYPPARAPAAVDSTAARDQSRRP